MRASGVVNACSWRVYSGARRCSARRAGNATRHHAAAACWRARAGAVQKLLLVKKAGPCCLTLAHAALCEADARKRATAGRQGAYAAAPQPRTVGVHQANRPQRGRALATLRAAPLAKGHRHCCCRGRGCCPRSRRVFRTSAARCGLLEARSSAPGQQ